MTLPLTVVMITLNEAHNMAEVLENLDGWAERVIVVDSYSKDATVDIALSWGAHVVQRRFRGFGDQWNFALAIPTDSPWTMKLDPDERLTDGLRVSIQNAIENGAETGYSFDRRLWFMGQPMPILRPVTRLWKTGSTTFSDVLVNEHPIVDGKVGHLSGELEHHDSPHLHHWFEKQNKYGTSEALTRFRSAALSAEPRLFGTALERRMWLKRNFWHFPIRYLILFWYHIIVYGAWRAGRVGWIWAHLRTEHLRNAEFKLLEMQMQGRENVNVPSGNGAPHPDAIQADD